jgi:ethanolamine utilization protein EutA
VIKEVVGVPGDLVSVDGIAVNEFDFVDISPVIQPANVVPIVVKSLLFAGGLDRRSVARALTQARREVVHSQRVPEPARD